MQSVAGRVTMTIMVLGCFSAVTDAIVVLESVCSSLNVPCHWFAESTS